MSVSADESRGKRTSRLTTLGIISLVIGLLIAVLYIYGAGNEMGMVNDLAFIGLAIAIE